MKVQYIVIIIFTAVSMSNKDSKQAFTLESRHINGKQFLVPVFNMFDCQKYMLPKLDNAPVHHTFYEQKDIEKAYEQLKINPKQLNHNLDKSEVPQKISFKKSVDMKLDNSVISSIKDQSASQDLSLIIDIPKNPRPPLKQTGFTHFIHIPLWDALKDVYENQIVPRIQEEHLSILMPLQSLHLTIMVFRLKKLEDLPLWSQVLKSAKKPKLSIKGVNIFPIKKNYAKVFFLNVKGAEDVIDRVVSKAIQLKLVQESELSHIKFDKLSGTYKAESHVTLLQTKGDDLQTFSEYLKSLNKINIPKVQTSQIRLSVIGSHNGNDYYNEQVHFF